MKYKIGELEVEAVQWNGENFEEIESFLTEANIRFNYEHNYKDYPSLFLDNKIVTIDEIITIINNYPVSLSEQDFNKIATKVKEPKFKVGDEAYCFELDDHGWTCFKKYKIWGIDHHGYHTDSSLGYNAKAESDLFTLEEAIEKLKEL